MKDHIFVGTKENLLDLSKIYQNTFFYTNPSMNDFEDIINSNFSNKSNVIFIEKDFSIDRQKLAKNINELTFLLIERTDNTLNFDFTNLTTEKLIEIISKFLSIKSPPKIYNNIFDTLFQYEILGYLPDNYINFDMVDSIKFFRSKLFELQKGTPNMKKVFLKSVLYRLEYSFKITGIKGLPSYYMLVNKIIQ